MITEGFLMRGLVSICVAEDAQKRGKCSLRDGCEWVLSHLLD